MKILHVIRGLANSSGTTHIVGPLAEAQARLGNEVTVFFVEKRGEVAVVPDGNLVESRQFSMTIPSRHYGWSRQLQAELRQRIAEFDVVHIHAIWNFPTWCAMREADRAGVPYIVAPQGSLEDWALRRSRYVKRLYARALEKPLFDRAARMQALTRAEAEQCRRFGIRSSAAILPNGVDLVAIDRMQKAVDLRADLDLPSDEKLLLFLGRLFPKKGLDLLAEAFGKVVQQRSDVTLLVAGDDAGTGYRAEVARMLDRSGAADKTRFLGEVKGAGKFEVLHAADLFVLPSYSEGLPVAVLEAMAVGLPVVVTPNCNIPEVEADEAGWTCSANPSALQRAIKESISNPPELLRRGFNSRLLAERQFTWPSIAQASMQIYQNMRRQPLADQTPLEVTVEP